jgi:hypothetical protein
MGGEWWFRILEQKSGGTENKASEDKQQSAKFDLTRYHALLFALKQEYEKYCEGFAEWPMDEKQNVFARFYYTCDRNHGSCGEWKLFWNPLLVPVNSQYSKIHARCADLNFKLISSTMQEKIVKAFPHHFEIYWGDGFSGYGFEFEIYSDGEDEYEYHNQYHYQYGRKKKW